jgi:hypothetical protein
MNAAIIITIMATTVRIPSVETAIPTPVIAAVITAIIPRIVPSAVIPRIIPTVIPRIIIMGTIPAGMMPRMMPSPCPRRIIARVPRIIARIKIHIYPAVSRFIEIDFVIAVIEYNVDIIGAHNRNFGRIVEFDNPLG